MKEVKFENIYLNKNQEQKTTGWYLSPKYRRKKEKEEFRMILDSYLNETAEDMEEHRVLMPRHNFFWDNGYEDVG